jgi:CRP-like cAMP-binding protein
MTDLADWLRDLWLLQGVSESAIAAFGRTGRVRTLAPGQMLFEQGDPAEAIYLVRTGRIAIRLAVADGRELVLDELHPGDLFGELALLTGQPRTSGAVARGRAEVVAIGRAEFLAALDSEPKLARRVLDCLARRLRSSSEREGALAFLEAPARLAQLLLRLDRQSGAAGLITASQEELAQHVGLARQTVAKSLGQWRRLGWLLTGRGRIVLLNRAALHKLVSADFEIDPVVSPS